MFFLLLDTCAIKGRVSFKKTKKQQQKKQRTQSQTGWVWTGPRSLCTEQKPNCKSRRLSSNPAKEGSGVGSEPTLGRYTWPSPQSKFHQETRAPRYLPPYMKHETLGSYTHPIGVLEHTWLSNYKHEIKLLTICNRLECLCPPPQFVYGSPILNVRVSAGGAFGR